ncbi:TetR family transcriptional regulator [Gluconacetobacter azotocaptans]|uniref:TetR family transcriptional regulator n=1 Tax=Gluconacetobacter azotocaptans TaxID=142834 RepID=A0A7W4PF70_9PROT|nr:TetR family transcriptional regulator [Gluconacetobacter azotocaptans]MBB2191385.1 TetR family transcriptional regulator [Gluconacetobacter azotocaptans]MBM9402530.1 TetR family transcriptional regulator [Gluconacetobacter azotocaptans]GBQ30529.1 TetR family transcriptional regulator [Gluconacetobacter azotocaptans DSM 13594]
MDNDQFDDALLRSAMERAAIYGWRRLTVVDAARDAGIPLDDARRRFPLKPCILLKLGRLADESALVDDGSTGTPREKLFDLLMRRFDVLQQYRAGVRAVLRALPFDPALALLLGGATLESMRWMASAAGLDISGVAGALRVKGLVGVWAYTLRAWDRDDSEDLSRTMATLDQALDRAARLGNLLERRSASPIAEGAMTGATDTDPSVDLPLDPSPDPF